MGRLQHLLLLLSVMMACASCASGPRVGIRPDYSDMTIQSVAMFPTYSTSTFGLSETEIEVVERAFQDATIEWLEVQGFAVVPPDQLLQTLRTIEDQEPAVDTLRFDRSLNDYFEPGLEAPFRGTEVDIVQALHRSGALPSDVILLSEVVYQTEGLCRQDPTEYSPYALMIGPADLESCVVSHFQAKLVDARTGATMWHNRVLREIRSDISPQTRAQNIRATVHATFGGSFGIASFVPRRDLDAPQRSAATMSARP